MVAADAAAELLEAAEWHLENEEWEECEAKARKSADGFREAGDTNRQADAFRMVVLCYCSSDRRKEAAHFAEERWAEFRQSQEKAAEGKMLLALSEANAHDRGPKKREEAFRSASDALTIFRDLNDKKMQGLVMLVLVNLYVKGLSSGNHQKNLKDAVELAQEALSLFQIVGNQRLEAKALHASAAARISNGSFEAGLRSAKDALRLFQDLSLRRAEFYECQAIAEWLLRAGHAKQAQLYAEDALALSRQLGYNSTWEVSAVAMLVRTLLARSQAEKALQLASEGVAKFTAEGDTKGEALMLDVLVTAHVALDAPREALEVAERALQLVRDLQRARHEAMLLRAMAQLHLRLEELDLALATARSALKLSQYQADRAVSLACLVQVHKAREDTESALQDVQSERELQRKAGEKRGEAVALLTAASLHKESEEAANAAVQALVLFREAGDLHGQTAAGQMAAQLHLAGGRQELALRQAQEVLPLLKEAGDSKGEAAMQMLSVQVKLLTLLAGPLDPSTFRFMQVAHKASTAAKEAVAAARRAADNRLVGSALCLQSQANLVAATDAVQSASAAVAVFRGAGDAHGEAYALLLNASGLLCSGRGEKAGEAAGKALVLFRELQDERGQALAEHALDVIENPPKLDELDEAYGEMTQVDYRSSMVAPQHSNALAEALKKTVRDTVNDIVGLDDIQDDTPLMQTGLTSQSAVLLRNALTKELPGPSLPFTMMFDYPSIAHLTEFFVRRGTQ